MTAWNSIWSQPEAMEIAKCAASSLRTWVWDDCNFFLKNKKKNWEQNWSHLLRCLLREVQIIGDKYGKWQNPSKVDDKHRN